MKITNTTPSKTEPYILLDDRFEISEKVLKMTPEERRQLAARLEAEGRRERDRIRREKLEHGNKAE